MEKKFSSDELPLAQLLDRAASGALQLPDFQRGWVWDDDHIRSLLVSISLSYPIGAVMTLVAGIPTSTSRRDCSKAWRWRLHRRPRCSCSTASSG